MRSRLSVLQKRQSSQTPGKLPLLQSRRSVSAKKDLPPEDSWLLRVLVQCLVTVGICAMTVASSGVTDTSNWNLIAIPLSAAGAYWSWRSRRRRNIAAKFGIALGMLIALGFFFAQLLSVPGDTRVVLAQLLIQLQVLHSFDLPRRKDLGYSMMIGLVLLGVAATISQTLTFGPLLLLFLILALPVLMLDYRSRLGILGQSWRSLGGAPKQFGLVLMITLLLGLIIFAALPRLPGYQLRTFPVSGSVDTTEDFDGSRIFNPGYINGGNGGQDGETGDGEGGSGDGSSPETGPGRINTDFYYGFNQRMNQNLRGEMIPRVVMRVRSQAEGFWRVMAFDQYDGQGWTVSRNGSTNSVFRSPISYQFLPQRLPRLGPAREVVQTYTMVNDFQNLLPVLYEPKEVYFPADTLAMDPEGALRAPGPLAEGTTYTVVSVVTARRPDLLTEAGTDYSEIIRSHYLQLPEGIQLSRIRAEAVRLLATSPEPKNNAFDQAEFLAQALKENYSVREDLPFFEENEDLVEAFLFRYQGGTPDHFSTVLTVMLRSIGIPARLAAGFGPGEFNPFTGFYTVRNTDAYAVTEVFFPRYGWFAFDPIPGHLALPQAGEEPDPFGVLRQVWEWLANATPEPVANILEQGLRAIAWVIYGIVGLFTRFSGRGWLQALWVIGLLTGFGLLGWLSWQGLKLWRRLRWLEKLAPMEKLYQQMLQRLAHQGYAKSASQTPYEYARALRRDRSFPHSRVVDAITQAYVDWRYGQRDPSLPQLKTELQQLNRASSR